VNNTRKKAPHIYNLNNMKKSLALFAFTFCMLFSLPALAEDATSASSPAKDPAKEKVSVPTLARRMQYGDVIDSEDIVSKEFPATRVQGNIIHSGEDLVGKTPRLAIAANTPIRKDEITTRQLVERGGTVTMVYKAKNLEISTTGQSLDKGSLGDTVRVRNGKSGAIVSGTVAGSNLVKVMGLN